MSVKIKNVKPKYFKMLNKLGFKQNKSNGKAVVSEEVILSRCDINFNGIGKPLTVKF